MMKQVCMAAALTLALGGAAFADTPIGPGVTGSGGTGKDTADTKRQAGAGGEAAVKREDGMPADRADATVSRTPAGGDSKAATADRDKARSGVGATGSAEGAAGGAASKGYGTK